MSGHLDLDALADLLAGTATEGAREHAAACPECRGRLAELEAAVPAVSASLARLPVPPEPADLAARVDAALAAEAAQADDARRSGRAADVLPMPSRTRTRTRALPALAGVAAVALLVTGGVLVTQTRDRSDDGTTAAGPSFPRSSTGRDYTPATLPRAVPALLTGELPAATLSARSSDTAATPEAAGSALDPLARLRTPEGLAACLTSVLDPESDELPAALDYASYQGRPALLVLLATDQPATVDVFVVGAGCDRAEADLLYFARVTTPS